MTQLLELATLVLVLTLVGLALVFYSGRRQAPSLRRFVCEHCATPTVHNERTLGAWRNGKSRFFCDRCYGEWSQQHSAPPMVFQQQSGSRMGCLGAALGFLAMPLVVFGLALLLQWLWQLLH